MIGNVGPLNPIPNFDHASTAVVVAWGVCLTVAATVGGWSLRFDPRDRRGRVRQTLLLVTAVLLVFAACGVSVRDHSHELRERLESGRRDRGAPEGPATPDPSEPRSERNGAHRSGAE